jgi:hypothetical protein
MSDEGQDAVGVIDQRKLGLKGHRYLGGVEALEMMLSIISKIRKNSSDIQERTFLAEIIKLTEQGRDQWQDKLLRHADKVGGLKMTKAGPSKRAH